MATIEREAARLTLPVEASDHIQGAGPGRVTLLEYGDFECPQCGRAYQVVKELQRLLGDRLRFVFRHFPLTSSHPHAQRAAEAAEWAATRDAFWPMHDALYANQGALADRDLLARATALGLPAPSLSEAWAQHTQIPRVKRDFLSGLDSGVTGTPAFFIDGVRHDGQWDLESLGHALRLRIQALAAVPPR